MDLEHGISFKGRILVEVVIYVLNKVSVRK